MNFASIRAAFIRTSWGYTLYIWEYVLRIKSRLLNNIQSGKFHPSSDILE